MDFTYYLDKFQQAANRLDKKLLAKKQMEVAVGIYHDSVFLKLYKKAWANKVPDPLTSASRIFFSVWINDKLIKDQKLFYNIHALKLRHLKGYRITSRKFADDFRKSFNSFEDQWPNVSVQFGPLTLMEGWQKVDAKNFQNELLELAGRFLEIDYLVDDLLDKCKQPGAKNK
jgi:hypothetical protein